MRQTLHIVNKDVHYLWREIWLLIGVCAIFFQVRPQVISGLMQALLMLASSYVIARCVYAEAIPGDRQFWLTRPYRRTSLLAAKLIFIFVFVNLPIMATRAAILAAEGFPIGANLPGLLWSQALLILGVWLPVAAFAAMSWRPAHLILGVILGQALAALIQYRTLNSLLFWPFGVQWIRDSIVLIILTAAASWILYLQYRYRQTLGSVVIAIGTAFVIFTVYSSLPAAFAMSLQSRLSVSKFDSSAIHIQPAPQERTRGGLSQLGSQVQVPMLMTVSGVPEGIELYADAMEVIFEITGGDSWKSEMHTIDGGKERNIGPTQQFTSTVYLDQSFFNSARRGPVTLRGSLYFTAFGHPESKTVSVQDKSVKLTNGLQCRIDETNRLSCRSAFRFPRQLVYVQDRVSTRPLSEVTSYSPIPSGMNVYPFVADFSYAPRIGMLAVTLITEEPLAHFRKDFEMPDFPLNDFAVAAPNR